MRAIVVKQPGGPEVLQLQELPDPQPREGDLIVRVRGAGVNRADLLQRLGRYPPPPGESEILGLEIAGEVEHAAGPWKRGDRVMALLGGGGYAERVRVPATLAMPVPERLSFEEAAAIPEAFLTASEALFTLGRVLPGEWVLIHVGFAMSRISGEEAAEQLRLLAMLGEDAQAMEELDGYRFADSKPKEPS